MLANIATFFVGIRNDITSIQAVKALLEHVCEYLQVDTASRSRIFHPKLFSAERKLDANLLLAAPT